MLPAVSSVAWSYGPACTLPHGKKISASSCILTENLPSPFRSEIYRFRSNCADYGSASISERNKLLSKRISAISQVGTTTISLQRPSCCTLDCTSFVQRRR